MNFDIKKYAKLAKIKLSTEEEARYQKDLEEVLTHVDELRAVDTSKVEPMTGGTNLRNVFREDQRQELLEEFSVNFPAEENRLLKVPKVIDHEA
ncbi:MAG: Asp-tRNA(Asn)/Glu-tRNA(Gln) amidotransferase subunit GatC [Candidatus Colwellbacteria bacterium]